MKQIILFILIVFILSKILFCQYEKNKNYYYLKTLKTINLKYFAQGYQSHRKEFNQKALQPNLEITEKSWPFLKKIAVP